jgi:hypothetical protein
MNPLKKSLLIAALLTAISASLPAQPLQGGSYHSVACFKVKPESTADFRPFVSDQWHKVAQARVNNGEITTWYLLRAVLPQGTSAACDFVTVAIFPGAPRLAGPEEINAILQKSGNSVSTLVSLAIFRNEAGDGSPKIGDYFKVNYTKVPGDIGEWAAFEKKNWLPVAQALNKNGATSAWSLNVQVLPNGADLPYQAVTIDVFPTMDAVFNEDNSIPNTFKALYPKTDMRTFMAGFEKISTIKSAQLFELDDVVTK